MLFRSEFTAEQLEIFVLGTKHIHAQASRAEFMRAVRTIRALEGAEETLKTIVKENEADFVRISDKKERTPEDQKFLKSYNATKGKLTELANARERVKLGVLGEDHVVAGPVVHAFKSGVFDFQNANSYAQIFELFLMAEDKAADRGNPFAIDITDVLGEFDKKKNLMGKIAARLDRKSTRLNSSHT